MLHPASTKLMLSLVVSFMTPYFASFLLLTYPLHCHISLKVPNVCHVVYFNYSIESYEFVIHDPLSGIGYIDMPCMIKP